MPTLVIVGAQWGDEAKGKIVDLLSSEADLIVRFTGGHNAGHTVLVGERLVKFHLLPAGMLHPGARGVLTSATAICPKTLVRELETFGEAVTPDRLCISRAAHVVLPYHALQDAAEEASRGSRKLGTTRRGIGPCAMDKAARTGLRMCEFVDDERRSTLLSALIEAKNQVLCNAGVEPLDVGRTLAEYDGYARVLRPYVGEAEVVVAEAAAAGQRVLFEGAHGTLLDINLGTYPYVTSTCTTAGGAAIGTGIGPRQIDHVLGVVKAYTTRVGEGPMPTELLGEEGDRLREQGQEYGTTTGRPRRCGHLDLVGLRFAARVNGFDSIAVTRLDVLSGLSELSVCVAYEVDGQTLEHFPTDTAVLARCRPVYRKVAGWTADISTAKSETELPEAARSYLGIISEAVGCPVSIISVGPEREQTILRDTSHSWISSASIAI
ncbi:MAG: adenylosuccinate synthetase [Fimbriimonadales bacterium]